MTDPDDAVRAVVFDFGGVLITTIANQIAKVAAIHDVEPTLMHELLLGPRVSSDDHPWHQAERGEIAVAEIQRGLAPWAERAGVELRGDEIDRLLATDQYTVVSEMIDRIAALRSAGLRTGLLTNTFAEFRPTMQRDLDFASFDVVVESFAVGARKPEPAIYAEVARRLDVDGRHIVYLDDFDQNLVPAQALGWQTILVTESVRALADLDAALGSGNGSEPNIR